LTESRTFFGRQVILTDVDVVTQDNILSVLEKALSTHETNRGEIEYLYDYYRGKQPVLGRVKQIRSEINNKIVENRANEIVSFKVGYLMGEPLQYVCRGGSEDASEAINTLNEFVFAEDKAAKDKELADWFTICGTAYRMCLPDKEDDKDEAPFEIYTLDPRDTFVIYHSGLGNKPMVGVKYIIREDGTRIYSCYTATEYIEIHNSPIKVSEGGKEIEKRENKIAKVEPHALGMIPIIEYPANSARQGAFEIVLPLLDAINETASDRIDGVEQFIQALLMFKGVDIEASDFDTLKQKGGIKVPVEGDVKYLIQELNQSQTQTLVDHMYNTVLTICGMPNRNGGSSTSDTGSAVIMRDGWSAAEARAKDTELMFKKSEKQFLRLALSISATIRSLNLKLSSIEIRFTRRNYENIQEKAQVLTTMLSNDKIHPRLAFEHCGMFADPEIAYTASQEYAEERKKETEQELELFAAKQVENDKAKVNDEVDEPDDEDAEGDDDV